MKYPKLTFKAAFDDLIFFFSRFDVRIIGGGVRVVAKTPACSVRSITRLHLCKNVV